MGKPESMSGLIGLDWGTTSLRAYWLDAAGEILETRASPWGVRHLPDGGFDAALTDITASWPRLPRLACGMVGSRQGWLEVPYMELPADTAQLGSAVCSLRANDGSDVHIVPGLRNPYGPDMMRGEETQLLGALALHPALIPDSTWTLMTGELFALLQQHSILCAGSGDAAANPDAFARGVIAARDSGSAGGFSRLFSARALMLDGTLTSDAVPEYLSGLLIGEELRSGLASNRFRHDAPLQLIGDAALCARYRLAAVHFDIDLVESLPDAAAHGLWQIACDIGLIGAGSSTAAKETSPC